MSGHREASIGLKRGTVQIAPYNPAWSALFEAERKRLQAALGDRIGAIEHIGSTSVPGLAAKPLIDMIVEVDDLGMYKELIAPLQELGYEFMPERVFTDRVFFPKGPRSNRTYHLSLVVKGSDSWTRPLHVRDYLRKNAEAREAYQKLKEGLALKYPNDRASYTKAKQDFIESRLQRT
jgi:GrpB-like predicted nucleotidyltransferase (UPF0157 family)